MAFFFGTVIGTAFDLILLTLAILAYTFTRASSKTSRYIIYVSLGLVMGFIYSWLSSVTDEKSFELKLFGIEFLAVMINLLFVTVIAKFIDFLKSNRKVTE